MTIDFRKVRKGDTITIKAEVIDLDLLDDEFPVKAEEIGWVFIDQIVGHFPRSIVAGDTVRLKRSGIVPGATFSVITIKDEFAWVQSSRGTPGQIILVNDLELA